MRIIRGKKECNAPADVALPPTVRLYHCYEIFIINNYLPRLKKLEISP